MILSFRAREQFGNIVVAETLPETERTSLRPVWLGWWRSQDFIKTRPQRCVNYFLERLLQFGRALLCFGRDVGIERQCGSHKGIMMLIRKKSTHASV